MNRTPLSASQFALLQQISSQPDSEESTVSPAELRSQRLAWSAQELPRLHAMGEEQSANAAFKEWNEFCGDSLGEVDQGQEELGLRLDETYGLAQEAGQRGETFHFSAHFAYEIMLWCQERFDTPEGADEDESLRLSTIFEGAYDYLAALAQHLQALEHERENA